MPQLPTKDDLARLKRAFIVAFAARCAMRALPAMAPQNRLSEVFGKGAPLHGSHILEAVRVTILLAVSPRGSLSDAIVTRASKLAYDARDAAEKRSTELATKTSPEAQNLVKSARLVMLVAAASARAVRCGDISLIPDINTAAQVAADLMEDVRQACGTLSFDQSIAQDFMALEKLSGGGSELSLVTLEFFKSDIGENGAEFKRWFNQIEAVISGIKLGWKESEIRGWLNGSFSVDAMLRQTLKPARKTTSPSNPKALPPSTPTTQSYITGGRFGNDGNRRDDDLDRTKLAEAIVEFFRDSHTETPLTVSIEGRWGSGKTHFMQTMRDLIGRPVEDGERRLSATWFNPWRHQNNEEMWAAFALEVFKQIQLDLYPWQKAAAHFRVLIATLEWPKFVKSVLIVIGCALAPFLVSKFGGPTNGVGGVWAACKEWLEINMHSTVGLFASLAGVIQLALKWYRTSGSHLKGKLELHINRPDYKKRSSFLEDFHKDFVTMMNSYLRKRRLVVFIDDLDRCDVPRAAELMAGINLMLGEDVPIIYVIGIDRAKVAAGIAVKHRDLLPFLYAREFAAAAKGTESTEQRNFGLEYGFEFIEKFIQIPVRLPPATPEEVKQFIRRRLTTKEGKADGIDGIERHEAGVPARSASLAPAETTPSPPEIAPTTSTGAQAPDEGPWEQHVLHASAVLEGNPRRIARLINLVRIQKRLALLRNISLTDGQLVKWTAVAIRWPIFILELERDPSLLNSLVSDGATSEQVGSRLRWLEERELREYLAGAGPENNSDLTKPGVVEALLRLGTVVPLDMEGRGVQREDINTSGLDS